MNKKYYLALLVCAILTISFSGLIIEVSIKNSDFVLPPTIDFSFNNNNACPDTTITFTPYLWI